MKYRKKPIVIEAEQWFKHGDHIQVKEHDPNPTGYPYFSGYTFECSICKIDLYEHGSIKTLEGSHIVCPKDWIIKGVAGEFYPCKPGIFEQTYDKVI